MPHELIATNHIYKGLHGGGDDDKRIIVQPDKLPPAFQKGPEYCALVFSYYADGKLRQTTCSAENEQQCEVARGNLVVIKGNCLFP